MKREDERFVDQLASSESRERTIRRLRLSRTLSFVAFSLMLIAACIAGLGETQPRVGCFPELQPSTSPSQCQRT